MRAEAEPEKGEEPTSPPGPPTVGVADRRRTRTWTPPILRGLRLYADLAVALGLVIVASTYLSIEQTGEGFEVVLLAAFLGFVYLNVIAILSLVQSVFAQWTLAAAGAIKILVLVILVPFCLRAGDYVHLALFYPDYRRQIDAQGTMSTLPIRFFWGYKTIWLREFTQRPQAETLVYDPIDAFAATIGTECDGDEGLGLGTRHLIGHFYVEYECLR